MKNWYFLVAFAGIGLAIYEQSQEKPNVILVALGVALCMFGILKVSAKLPSKNQDDNKDGFSERR